LLGRYYLARGNTLVGQQHILRSIQTVQQFVSALPVDERATYQAEHLRPFFAMTRLLASKGDTRRAYMCMESARGQSLIKGENWCDPHAPDLPHPIRIADGSIALAYFAGDTNDPLLCFFLRGDSITVHNLKTAMEIEAEIRNYLRTGNAAAGEEVRRRLANDLLPAEVLAMLSKGIIQRILIAPEAGLNKISFESLIPNNGERGSHSSLIDFAAIDVVPSVLAWHTRVAKHVQPKDALIITAANVNSCPESLRLPWADKEATEVAKFASSGSSHLVGTEATAAILGSDVSQYRILHLAVHGQSAHNIDGSELLLDCSSNDVLAGDRIKTTRLSGQLIVLSSCESALGKPSNGESIDSLADVFLHAGASCVIAARSRISDKHAYDLMNTFYHELVLQKPIDIALQQTQRALEQKIPVQEWGAFSAFGRCDYTIPITPTLMKRFELRLETRH
jgi:CHAT domain-containing protein